MINLIIAGNGGEDLVPDLFLGRVLCQNHLRSLRKFSFGEKKQIGLELLTWPRAATLSLGGSPIWALSRPPFFFVASSSADETGPRFGSLGPAHPCSEPERTPRGKGCPDFP